MAVCDWPAARPSYWVSRQSLHFGGSEQASRVDTAVGGVKALAANLIPPRGLNSTMTEKTVSPGFPDYD